MVHYLSGFGGALPSTWTRTDVGQKTRWRYRDDNYFRRREVFLDRETGKALVFANRPGDFEKMMRIVGKHFEPEERVPLNASMMVLTIAYDILGAADEIDVWEKPFGHSDEASRSG